MDSKAELRQRRIDLQLRLWVQGCSSHNEVDDECTPDFSCCKPQLKASIEDRKRFVAGTSTERDVMLMVFLKACISTTGHKVHVTG